VDAELLERGGVPCARFRRHGRTITAPLTKAGKHAGRRVTVEARAYAVEYTDATGRVRREKAYVDKAASQAKAAQIERAVERERAGIIDRESIDRTARLTESIERHVSAYELHLMTSGASIKHRREARRRLRTLLRECDFRRLADIATEPVQKWLARRGGAGMGPRTRNTYAGALRAFIRWCLADGRMALDPLVTLKRADEAGDIRRTRRALTEPELAALLHVAELRPLADQGREIVKRDKRAFSQTSKPGPLAYGGLTPQNIDAVAARGAEKLRYKPARLARLRRLGRERGLIYRTLVLTGLRRGELAQLCWRDLDLDAPQAWCTVRAAVAKNRRCETIPVREDLAAALREWWDDCGRPAGDLRVFRVPKELVRILQRDLLAAGIARRVKDENGRWRIDTRDAGGRTIDVHSMRHTTATYLAKAGVAPRTAQSIMRHSDIRLTLGTYTDPTLLNPAAALEALPRLDTPASPERNRATGTDDATAAGVTANALGGLLGGIAAPNAQDGSSRCAGSTAVSAAAFRDNVLKLHGLATQFNEVRQSGRPGSNRQHSAWKADALPIELRPQTPTYQVAWRPSPPFAIRRRRVSAPAAHRRRVADTTDIIECATSASSPGELTARAAAPVFCTAGSGLLLGRRA